MSEKKKDSITTDKSIVYEGHIPEDFIMSVGELASIDPRLKELETRVVYLEEKIETLTKHDDKLKTQFDDIEKQMFLISNEQSNIWDKIEDIDSDIAEWEKDRCQTSESEQVVKVLAKLLDLVLFNKED